MPIRVWLKIDSGMNRLGFRPDAAQALWRRLRDCAGARSDIGLMSHFASADDRTAPVTARQLDVWRNATRDLPGERSLANSAATLGWPESHADWIRPGIMLYGVSPFVGGRASDDGLRPVMTLRTRLIATKTLCAGERVGYGGDWLADRDTSIGIAAIGYGDGYPRHAPSGTPVLVNGRRVALVGRVSMDMLALDLSSQPQARVGDPVTLWGEGLAIETIAECATTIGYELLCGVTQRVPRRLSA